MGRAPSTPGTYYYGACVEPTVGESNTENNCSGDEGVRVTVSSGSGDGGGGGGSPGGGGATEAVWPCPFGDIEGHARRQLPLWGKLSGQGTFCRKYLWQVFHIRGRCRQPCLS